jgi:hypothetical protein
MSTQDEFNFGEEIPVVREFTEQEVEEVRYTLDKYDGDYTADEIAAGLAGSPVETIVVVNGEIVEHVKNGEVLVAAPEEGG